MLNPSKIRDFALSGAMLVAFLIVVTNPYQKLTPDKKIQIARLVPEHFERWSGLTRNTFDYSDKWQSINELLLREYSREDIYSLADHGKQKIGFVLEYNSDLRNNSAFHFPENCHRANGNQVEFLKPLSIPLDKGRTLKAKTVFIKGIPGTAESVDKIVAYWLVIDGKQKYETLAIKLDQILAGVFSGAQSGFLVRFDYFEGLEYSERGIAEAQDALRRFIKDLYYSLDLNSRSKIFGS